MHIKPISLIPLSDVAHLFDIVLLLGTHIPDASQASSAPTVAHQRRRCNGSHSMAFFPGRMAVVAIEQAMVVTHLIIMRARARNKISPLLCGFRAR